VFQEENRGGYGPGGLENTTKKKQGVVITKTNLPPEKGDSAVSPMGEKGEGGEVQKRKKRVERAKNKSYPERIGSKGKVGDAVIFMWQKGGDGDPPVATLG